MNNVVFSCNSDEWYTPLDFFKVLNDEFHFTLDPCGCFESEVSSFIGKYYDSQIDGLSLSWENEVCFVNPPFSDLKTWSRKIAFEVYNNNATVVLLMPSRTDTIYFHKYILPFCDEIRFIKGRLKFSGEKNCPFPSILVIFKPFDLNDDKGTFWKLCRPF